MAYISIIGIGDEAMYIRTTVVLVLVAVGLSSCGVVQRSNQAKMSDAGLTTALKKPDDGKLCNAVAGKWGNPRWQEFALRESVSRGLGDCSYDHKKCVSIGFTLGTGEYKNCRLTLAAAAYSRPVQNVTIKQPAKRRPQKIIIQDTSMGLGLGLDMKVRTCTRTGNVINCF